jgi:protein TonB
MSPQDDLYSVREIALAARVSPRQVRAHAEYASLELRSGGFIRTQDAVRLVRALTTPEAEPDPSDFAQSTMTLLPRRGARTSLSLVISGLVHAVALAALVTLASMGLLSATYTDQPVVNPEKLRLVYLISPGPGGGGGGGGLEMPAPPPPAKREAPLKKMPSSAVPPPRRVVPPPRPVPPRPVRPLPLTPPPVPTPRPDPPTLPPAQAPAVQAPVVPVAADTTTTPGLPTSATQSAPSSQGPGTGGGVGSGAGTGLGEGQGSGIGPGSGGGTGGGPFRPGSGVEPPVLLREIRPVYTVEARRRSIEGDVVLDIVVRENGSVGSIRVTRGLDSGLDQKAVEAVRQWRFEPARRRGTPVDVVVEVSVEFKLRNP